MKQKYRNGVLVEADNGQDRFLKVLYGSTLGRILLKPLTTPGISNIAGAFLSTKASCILIKPFIKKNHIDMSQFEDVSYDSYNEFFSRKIRKDARVIDMTSTHFISPADSKLTVLPITKDSRFTLKHTDYTIESLLKNETIAKEFMNGYCTAVVLELIFFERKNDSLLFLSFLIRFFTLFLI